MVETLAWPFGTWGNIRSFTRNSLHMWALSVSLGAKWFRDTRIITDGLGLEVLGKLDLPVTRWHKLVVPQELSFMPLWGKHKAHHLMAQAGWPYWMLDYDFFLWRRPDDELLRADAVAQLREETNVPVNGVLDRLQALNPDTPIPRFPYACNAGVSGGCDLETLQRWTGLGVKLAEDPKNRAALTVGDGWVPASAFDESLYLAHFGERMRFLSPDKEPHSFEEAGFTHLAGPLKVDPVRQLQVETRLGLQFPAAYERVQRVWFDDVARR